MSLVFVGKSLSCIAATGTIGAVATIPKIKNFLVSVEKDISHFSPNSQEKKVFQQLVDVSDFQVSQEVQKKTDIEATIKKILNWLKTNGGCRLSLAIESSKNSYFKVVGGKSESDINKSLSIPQKNMNGKNKLERLADDLMNGRKEIDTTKPNKYQEYFKTRCQRKKGQFTRLQWRGQIFENFKDTTVDSEGLEGLTNLWVFEKTNSKG